MRLAAGITLITSAINALLPGPSLVPTILNALAATAGALLILGLWTPLAGSAVAIVQLWTLVFQPGDSWTRILLAALGVGLALVGPGAWSIDARLFGWKRINFRDHKR